jgi:hypothetical protein
MFRLFDGRIKFGCDLLLRHVNLRDIITQLFLPLNESSEFEMHLHEIGLLCRLMAGVSAAHRHQVADSVRMHKLILDDLALHLLLQATVNELQD